jgi:hypothetical protein
MSLLPHLTRLEIAILLQATATLTTPLHAPGFYFLNIYYYVNIARMPFRQGRTKHDAGCIATALPAYQPDDQPAVAAFLRVSNRHSCD